MMIQRFTGKLTLAFGLLAVAAILAYARRQGFVSPDLAVRGTMAAIGLMLAFYGNAIPKAVKAATAKGLAIQRFTGWAFALAGLAYAVVWALAPMSWAADASMIVVASAMLSVIGFMVLKLARPA